MSSKKKSHETATKHPKETAPQAVADPPAADVATESGSAPVAPVKDVATTAIANPAFVKLDEARAQVTGLSAFKPAKLSRRGTSFVSEKYFAQILQTIDQTPALQAATGIDTTTFRSDVAFISALSSFPAACQQLENDVAIYLDTLLAQRSKEARAATAWLAWKANKDTNSTAAKTVEQLRAMPPGRGASVSRKKPRAARGTAAPKPVKAAANGEVETNGVSEASAPPNAQAALEPTASKTSN